MALLADLKAAAVARGLFPDDAPMSPQAAFALVRDMPYVRASSRAPEATIAEWRGTCSGKHYLLRALFDEFGFDTTLIAATHEFTADNSPWLPTHLLDEIARGGPVPDVHNFLRVQTQPGRDWISVDATWPMPARDLGMPVNETFDPGRDHAIACDPIEIFHVPDDEDPQAFKQRLIEVHAGAQAERRDRFIEDLSAWLAERLGGASAK